MIYVTHDQIEAMTLADRIVVMRDGRHPADRRAAGPLPPPGQPFVAGFIGSPRMNILTGTAGGGRVEIAGAGSLPTDIAATGAVTAGVRPERLRCFRRAWRGLGRDPDWAGISRRRVFLHVRLGNGEIAVVQVHPDHGWKLDQSLVLRLRPNSLHLFDAATGVRLAG